MCFPLWENVRQDDEEAEGMITVFLSYLTESFERNQKYLTCLFIHCIFAAVPGHR